MNIYINMSLLVVYGSCVRVSVLLDGTCSVCFCTVLE